MAEHRRRSNDRTIRAEDNGQPLLDADGEPFVELEVDSADEIDEVGVTIAELAAGQREWRFGHVIVDEAQDLTPMQWRMVARRAIGGSMTIVGDLAQRTSGEVAGWDELIGGELAEFDYAELTVNYRSPAEVSVVADRLLAVLAPDLTPSKAIRSSGHPPEAHRVEAAELVEFVRGRRRRHVEGRLAVIGFGLSDLATEAAVEGVIWLDPFEAKGLEFDHVVIVEPSRFLDLEHGLSLLYIAVTRATHGLVFAHETGLPEVLGLDT